MRGNLLFYFRSRDHFSEPSGVIVLEACSVNVDKDRDESTFGIVLDFGDYKQHLAAYTEFERQSRIAALKCASYGHTKSLLESLRAKLLSKVKANPPLAASVLGEDLQIQQERPAVIGKSMSNLK